MSKFCNHIIRGIFVDCEHYYKTRVNLMDISIMNRSDFYKILRNKFIRVTC